MYLTRHVFDATTSLGEDLCVPSQQRRVIVVAETCDWSTSISCEPGPEHMTRRVNLNTKKIIEPHPITK